MAIAPPSFVRQTGVGVSTIPPESSSSSACSTNKAVTVPTRTFSLHVSPLDAPHPPRLESNPEQPKPYRRPSQFAMRPCSEAEEGRPAVTFEANAW